jgi:hypothetical protein
MVIQGVHAETIVFAKYEQANGFVMARSLPSIGVASQLGGREIELLGTRPRPFRVRVTDVRERSKKTISCQLELHDVARLYAPLMRVELTFTPDGPNTRVGLTGSTARDLTPDSSAQAAMSRGLANEYARGLLDQIAKAIEERPLKTAPTSKPRAAKEGALRKRL